MVHEHVAKKIRHLLNKESRFYRHLPVKELSFCHKLKFSNPHISGTFNI